MVGKKEKILFVLSSDLYYRNYLTTDALEDLVRNYDLKIIVSSDLQNLNNTKLHECYLSEYSARKENHLSIQKMLRYRMLANINKSLSFFMREARTVNFQYLYITKKISFFHVLKNYAKFFGKIYKFLTFFTNTKLVPKSYWNYLANKTKGEFVNATKLEELIENFSPDIVIWPDSSFMMESFHLVNICDRLKIPTFMIVDNWDNVSSKTILYEKPNYIGVWGKQSKQHAIGIQGFREENVLITGSARFDHYYEDMKNDLLSHFDFDYILFAGFSLPFDEIEVLQKLDKIVEKQNKYKNIKIIYRPHPWRQKRSDACFDVFDEKDFKNVILDPQLKDAYDSGVRIQPDVKYYSSLITNAVLVVSSPTSFVIESLIFEKKVLLLAHDDKIHYTSPHRCLQYHTHLKELPVTKNIFMCTNLDKLSSLVLEVLDNNIKPNKYIHDVDFFVKKPKGSYKSQLYNQVSYILKESCDEN